MQITPAQKRVLKKTAERQGVHGSAEHRVAWRLEERGLIGGGRCSISEMITLTYYELTDAGRTAVANL